MKKLAGLLALTLLLGGGYLLSQGTRSSAPTFQEPAEPSGRGVVGNEKTSNDPFDIVIPYTDEGYATTSITVKSGTRVRFLNQSGEETWPASGIHPTHTLYPEKEKADCLGSSFDSCAALKTGEFFDFTFNYTGTWSFHDHLHAYHIGSIVVIE
ncbi:hypothetical protein HY971_02150 [Candidatus Kaiserbacteria bacterium]|nr:hypothetical protein [Candidatus Kaiserbacteria bacterium]